MTVKTEGFSFTETARDGHARTGIMKTPRAVVHTPVFMPVGTLATVKSQTPDEIEATGARIILANTYHLWVRPGPEVIETMGGVPKFMGWPHAMLTDSGGFQVFSLAALRQIDDEGVTFRSHLDGKKLRLTPEESMRIQRALGADIAMAFDECPPGGAELPVLEAAMRRTTAWAKRCLLSPWREGQARFGIVQGGTNTALRLRHLEEIAGMSAGGREFDGIALGGFSVGEPIPEMHRAFGEIVHHLPRDKPRYVMGIGTPYDLLEAMGAGVDLFDCVLPSRNARNGQALTWHGRVNLKQARHKVDQSPLDARCRCSTCSTYSRAYLSHLIRADEMLGARLVTHHNLFFYGDLCAAAQIAIAEGRYAAFASEAANTMREGDEIGRPPGPDATTTAKARRAEKRALSREASGPTPQAQPVPAETALGDVNDMNAMKLLLNRRSVSKLDAPAPDADVIDRVMEAALRSPDHGALRPWKVLSIEGKGRAKFGEVLAEAYKRQRPDASEDDLESAAKKAMRAPLILIVAADLKESSKIPAIEQVLSAGAVAQTLLLALEAEGFGAVWKTGAPAYDPYVKERLGLKARDHIVAILYVGTAKEEPSEQKRPKVKDVLSPWEG
jgi:queuine tRNA-ribosyltransferase